MSIPDSPIDAVVTWVDGEDEAWRATLRTFAGRGGDPQLSADGPRFRDNGLLRYCLRSLHRNLPWLRRIHLVTAGHLPRWLDRSADGVNAVAHDAIFPDHRHLPTFNSMAIESHLHRIPGLSETFIYFNDDFFVLTPVARDGFVTADGGHIIPLERWAMPSSLVNGHVIDRGLAFTQLLLNQRLGAKPGRLHIPHVGHVFSRDWIEHLWSEWPDALAQTSAERFRMTSSVALRALYYHSLREWPRDALPAFARGRTYPERIFEWPDYRLIATEHGPELAGLRRDLAEVEAAGTTFLCLNDDTSDPNAAAREAEVMTACLEAWFPDPTPWEIPGAGRSVPHPAHLSDHG